MAKIAESRAVRRVREAMSYGKSPVQIARELGWDPESAPDQYPPEWVHGVTLEILEGFDAYTLEQQLKIGLNDLQRLSAEARENYKTTNDPRHAQQAIAALGAITERIQAALDRVGEKLFELDDRQVEVLVRLVNQVTFGVLETLYQRHPELLPERAEYEEIVVGELRVLGERATERS